MKRFVFIALVAVMVMGLVVIPAAAKDKITVTFWHAMSKGHSPFLEELTKRFNESQDEIEVQLIYQGKYGDLQKKILGSVAAGKPPVMAQAYENWLTKLINANTVEAVQWYIGSVFTQEEIDDVIWGFQKSSTWNDIMYTMPFNKSITVLYANTDMVPVLPTNWEELIETATAATKDVNGDGVIDVYGFGIRPNVDTFGIFLRQAGGTFLNEDETKAVFNDEAGQKALQFLHDMVYKYKCGVINSGYLNGPLGEEKLAMYMDTSAGIPYTVKAVGDKFNWTTAPVTRDEQYAATFAGTNIAVFSKHSAEVKLAAMKYLKFITSTESTTYWAVNSGYLPVRYSAQETKEWKEYLAGNPFAAAGAKELELNMGVFDPKPDAWSQARNIIGDYIEIALLNKMTIKDALDKAVAEINALLD
ncbi:MAG: ABC transporter substrate-binding protein [Halanaerobiales bacterium]|nr:ABC transporter substrate-binding protein [Halanaerobiales bacterium]